MKKMLHIMVITILLSINVLSANAAPNAVLSYAVSQEEISPMSEETVWYTRVNNGKLQRRLWSITYQKWLTEWEDVE